MARSLQTLDNSTSLERAREVLLSEARNSSTSAALLAALSSFVLLRWADQQEAEQEARGLHPGALVPGSRWRDFCDLSGAALLTALTERVLPGLKETRDVGAGSLARQTRAAIHDLAQLRSPIIDALVEFVRALPLTTAADLEQSLVSFDDIIDCCTVLRRGAVGELVTPHEIVELIVELAAPRPGERIYDPCFGVAGVLSSCARRVHAQLAADPPELWARAQRESFFGVERSQTAYLIGICRMILSGVAHPQLELGDAFRRPLPTAPEVEGFDLIVMDPPFGKAVIDDTARFPVKTTSTEALFLQHAMASLRPGGRAVVVLSHGALFRPGADATVRKRLLGDYRIDCIVSLPPGADGLLGNTRTGVVVFRSDRPRSSVRFVDAGLARKTGERCAPEGRQLGAAAIVASIHGSSEAYEARDVSVEDLMRHDATLLPLRHDGPLPAFVQEVRAAEASVPVRPLEDVAEIFAGVSYSSRGLHVGRSDPTAVGLLRVTEVKEGDTLPPARFLVRDAASAIAMDRRLRPGDVVFTRSGSIGRAAVIANGAVGCVAASGLAVLRPQRDALSPHYLAALLNSSPIRGWAAERARGVTIQHLPLSELRALEIPIPDMDLQNRIVRAHLHQGTDASILVLRALTSLAEDPVASWLESSAAVQRLLAVQRDPASSPPLGALAAMAVEMRDASDRVALLGGGGPMVADLLSWFIRLGEGLASIADIDEVPLGTGRLAILDVIRRAVDDAASAIRTSTSPAGARAREVTEVIAALLTIEAERCLTSFRLVPSVDPATVAAGSMADLTVAVRNEGAIALRNLRLRALEGEARSAYVDTGQAVTLTMSVRAPAEPCSWSFTATWDGQRLDGHAVKGSFPLAFEVRAASRPAPNVDFGTSPYIVGGPVDRVEMLYGRVRILDNIRRQLGTDRRANIVLLEGNRRSGKTSILKRLERPGELPGWIVVNHSLQGAEGDDHRAGVPTKEIFRRIAHDLGLAVAKTDGTAWPEDLPRPGASMQARRRYSRAVTEYFDDDHPFEVFDIYVQSMLEAAAPRRILLMLDEFDKIQEGIDAGVTSPQVPENLRYLFHTYPELGGVLSGSRRLTKLRNEYWSALFGIGYVIPVGPLAPEDARALVTVPVTGRLVYVPAARDRIVDLCACQPFLIQTLCNRIFEEAAERREGTVTLEAVERAASGMTADNEHFETLWGYARTERRRLILALLCELSRGRDGQALDAGVLGDELDRRGVTLPGDGLGDDIDHLRELELVELEAYDGYQRYRLTIPLMADWIRRNKDFSDLTRRAAREAEEDAA